MKTLKKIKNIVIETGKAIAKKPLETILITALATTLSACKPRDKPYIPINQPPAIQTVSLPDAVENSSYSTPITADDPELEPITYSITGGTADLFLEIDPDTGELYNDTLITDAESGLTHDLTIKAEDDKGNFTEKTFNLDVINTENVAGNVKDVTNDANLSNIEVKVGSYSGLTDVNGNYIVVNIQNGNHDVEINDTTGNEDNYFTYKAGKLIVNKTKNLEDIDFKLIPTSLEDGDTKTDVLDHIANCIRTRYDAEKDIKKWEICPTFRIYTLESSTSNLVDQAKIDLVKDIINNELYKVNTLFTNPNIEEIAEIPPAGFFNGIIKIYWSDLLPVHGANSQQFNGNKIIAAGTICKTSVGKGTWLQELTECIIGGGESNIYSSILNDPRTEIDYTPIDLKLWKIHQNRPAGNKDLDTDNNHDVNPSTYIINP